MQSERARVFAPKLGVVASLSALGLLGCGDESIFVYRLPYVNGTQLTVWQDPAGHSRAQDTRGIGGGPLYGIAAARTGVVERIVDNLTQTCCGGTCGNNYVWLSHFGDEWTKYSHLATNSVTGTAGLSVGDIVLAGEFLGYESDVGRACGSPDARHLHFEVAVPNDPDNPLLPKDPTDLGDGGFINGVRRIPRFCSVPGEVVTQGEQYVAQPCSLTMACIRSEETPSTQNQCEGGLSGEICVQEVEYNFQNSTYAKGVDFAHNSMKLSLDWCGDASCTGGTPGRAIEVTVIFDADLNKDPASFIANCQTPQIREVVHDVEEILIRTALNLSPENTACGGNTVTDGGFAKWELCGVADSLVDRSNEISASRVNRAGVSTVGGLGPISPSR